MKYILDYDRTLFDTQALYDALDRDGVGRRTVTPAIWQDYQVADFLYPDTVPFLQRHQPSDLIILTAYNPAYGPEAKAYQVTKVEQSPVIDLVSQIHYVPGDKGQTARQIVADHDSDQAFVFVDDVLQHCQAVQAAVPACRCFLMQRQPSDVSPSPGITAISSLDELTDLLA